MNNTSFGFPFRITPGGRVARSSGDNNLRAKILQVLLTAPGERVHRPEFGCGLRDLVFDPNNTLLVTATEFTVRQALQRWLGDDILVERVTVSSEENGIIVEVDYVKKQNLQPQGIKIIF